MDKRLEEIRGRESRLIVGVETGNSLVTLGASLVEVSGRGDDTVIDIYTFKTQSLQKELTATLEALAASEDFDSEEIAGINFLMTHQINSLFQELFEDVQIDPGDVDILGIKCLELGGLRLPQDPSVLSEMTGCVVASSFRIGMENGQGPLLDVRESILQGMVGEMIEKLGIEPEAREAVAVALLANEAVYHESVDQSGKGSSGSITLGSENAGLYGDFFFPN